MFIFEFEDSTIIIISNICHDFNSSYIFWFSVWIESRGKRCTYFSLYIFSVSISCTNLMIIQKFVKVIQMSNVHLNNIRYLEFSFSVIFENGWRRCNLNLKDCKVSYWWCLFIWLKNLKLWQNIFGDGEACRTWHWTSDKMNFPFSKLWFFG